MSASHPPCKSELMLLSEKFRDRFASSTGREAEKRIDLNDCALALGVPRRRLYDITIVYEAAEVISSHSLISAMPGSLSRAHHFYANGPVKCLICNLVRLRNQEMATWPASFSGDRQTSLWTCLTCYKRLRKCEKQVSL